MFKPAYLYFSVRIYWQLCLAWLLCYEFISSVAFQLENAGMKIKRLVTDWWEQTERLSGKHAIIFLLTMSELTRAVASIAWEWVGGPPSVPQGWRRLCQCSILEMFLNCSARVRRRLACGPSRSCYFKPANVSWTHLARPEIILKPEKKTSRYLSDWTPFFRLPV